MVKLLLKALVVSLVIHGAMAAKEPSKKPRYYFPETINGFGYKFDEEGKLRNIETGEGFHFVVKEGSHEYNQLHYEALGEVITKYVYKLLETECMLRRIPVPADAEEDEPQSFVFISEDAMLNTEKLLVLIHGSGVVRAGQWARRLIINDNLKSGTQVPFIQRAVKNGYGVLVMNTNDNVRVVDGQMVKIRESENPERHADHVWNNYIMKAKAKHIAIIAHSYGGVVTTNLFANHEKEFVDRVFAVAMTDSVHFINKSGPYKNLVNVARNWVTSKSLLDTPLQTVPGDIPHYSAGVGQHEMTSWASFKSIFKFLDVMYKKATRSEEMQKPSDRKEL
ncbi:cotranscriptional regulator ARB2A isoform X2 [Oratosquilla oratoria]